MVDRIQMTTGSEAEETAAEQAGDPKPLPQSTAEAVQQVAEEKDQSQEKILGKFTSVEELKKGYQELERKFSQRPPKEETGEEAPLKSGEDAESEARDELATKGVDLDALSDYYSENGELTDAQYSELEAAGYPRSRVDEYIAGQSAMAELCQVRAFEITGGQEGYAQMNTWATETLSEDEIDAFNAEVSSNNPALVKSAVEGLYARYALAEGHEPSRHLQGGSSGSGSSGAYSSWAEVQVDMGKPEYSISPAFREKVAQKLSRSQI